LLDELSRFGFRYTICSCTVLKVQIYLVGIELRRVQF